jgi:citrate lyase subunit beta/citryl-CoA lyase
VWWFDVLVTQVEAKLNLSKRIAFEALIEEAEGVTNAASIAAASPRLEAIILGAGDLSASMHARVDTNFQPIHPYPGDFWHAARFQVVIAARSAGILAIDAPYPAYQDPEGFEDAAGAAAAMGFDGKWAIHPSQIEIANRVFSPSPAELEWAIATREAYSAAQAEGVGAIGRGGMLVDAAHMRHVETILSRSALGTSSDDAAAEAT